MQPISFFSPIKMEDQHKVASFHFWYVCFSWKESRPAPSPPSFSTTNSPCSVLQGLETSLAARRDLHWQRWRSRRAVVSCVTFLCLKRTWHTAHTRKFKTQADRLFGTSNQRHPLVSGRHEKAAANKETKTPHKKNTHASGEAECRDSAALFKAACLFWLLTLLSSSSHQPREGQENKLNTKQTN